MDENNVHQFWGISPALDLKCVARGSSLGEPIKVLQVAPADARHTLQTLCCACQDAAAPEGSVADGGGTAVSTATRPEVHAYVWEDHPEGLARHMLLLAVFLDATLPARERVQVLLELHGNALLREKTAQYLGQQARRLEQLVVHSTSPQAAADTKLASLFDLSMLKFQDKDALVDVLQRWRHGSSTSSSTTTSDVSGAGGSVSGGASSSHGAAYDMVKAWDGRCRKWYHDRYDFRRNMIDYDYHMRLQPLGVHGQDPSLGTTIHFHHFRHWRMHGIAYELRDSVYSAPNRSLLSTVYGRAREFKDRNGKDVGRSVAAWGWWGDILNSPYHSWGTTCEDKEQFKVSNKQFATTAVDISEHNLTALLQELRTGRQYTAADKAKDSERTKLARGPTTLDDLQEEGAKEHQRRQEQEQADVGTEGAPSMAGDSSNSSTATTDAAASVAAVDTATSTGGVVPAAGSDSAAVPSDGDSATGPAGGDGAAAGGAEDAAARSLREAEEALRAEEEALDAEAMRNCSRFKVVLMTSSELSKPLTSRAKFAGAFDALFVGHRHIHLLVPEQGLQKVLRPGATAVIETSRHMVLFKPEQTDAFLAKIKELAGSAGWVPADDKRRKAVGATAAHAVFTLANGPSGAKQ